VKRLFTGSPDAQFDIDFASMQWKLLAGTLMVRGADE
jgi:hypothetical protein